MTHALKKMQNTVAIADSSAYVTEVMYVSVAFILGVLMVACGFEDNEPPHLREGAMWGYETHNGPERWGTLDPKFGICAQGKEQSPIDLVEARRSQLPPLKFNYRQTNIVIENNGHTIKVSTDPGSNIVLDEVRYDLKQLHFHHGSEHTIAGQQLPLEMHLVHQNDQGALAVVGVLFTEGATNKTLQSVWGDLPSQPTPSRAVAGKLDLDALMMPASHTTWRYRGSLTTPPCSEGVEWVVMTETLTMSAAQIEAFARIYPANFRPVQPRGARVLHRSK